MRKVIAIVSSIVMMCCVTACSKEDAKIEINTNAKETIETSTTVETNGETHIAEIEETTTKVSDKIEETIMKESTMEENVTVNDKEQETLQIVVQTTEKKTAEEYIEDITTLPVKVETNVVQKETTSSGQINNTEETTSEYDILHNHVHNWQTHYEEVPKATVGDVVTQTESYIAYYFCADVLYCGATKPGEPKPEVTVKHTCRRNSHYVDVPMAGGVEVWQVVDYYECPGCGSIVANDSYEALMNEYNAINTWIEENISDDMTDKEKIEKLLYHIEFQWKYQMQVSYCFTEKKGSCYSANGCFATIGGLLGVEIEVYNAVEEMHLDKTKANHYLCNVRIDGTLYKADATPRSDFMNGLTNPEFWAEQCADPWWNNTVEGY